MKHPRAYNFIERFNSFIKMPGDSKENILTKQIWFALASASILYPVAEMCILASRGIYDLWYLRLLLGVTVGVLMVIFLVRKDNIERLGILLCFNLIVITGILMYLKGGLLHSMGIVFISLAATVLSLIFTSATNAHLLFSLFIVLTLVGTLMQPIRETEVLIYDTPYRIMYISKFLTGTFALYFASVYFQTRLKRIKDNEKARLEALDVAKTRFYTNMTHEFRTPLSMIMGWTEHISDDPKKHLDLGLETIQRNAQKLLDLVNQLMDISKIEAGSMVLNNQYGNVLQLVKTLVEEHRGIAEMRKIKLHFINEQKEVLMDHDEAKVEAITLNILSNAIKFTPEGGDVYVQTDVLGNAFILKVRDTGPGIPEGQLPYIFDRFYQADDSSTRKTGGSGIGLAVAKGLVELMGGTIAASSTKGEGTSFTIRLPITRLSPASPSCSRSSTNGKSEEHRAAPNLQHVDGELPIILVAEDNVEMLNFLFSILGETYTVLLAKDGKQALKIAREHTPDMVISDIMMPEMDGYAMCKALKTDIRTSHIPIILLTAKADLDSKIIGLELGAEAYLTKPFSKRELLVRIRKLFELRDNLQKHYWTEGWDSEIEDNHVLLSSQENIFLQEVRNLLQTRVDNPDLNVDSLAGELNMSYSQLYRKIKSLTGRTPNQLIREVRLRKACEFLKSSDSTVSETAYNVGIEDPAYFARAFKKEYGVTPSEYRRISMS